MKHLAFTGTKKGATQDQLDTLLSLLVEYRDKGYQWMHNGDCIGADNQAGLLWLRLNRKILLHPPTEDKYRGFLPYYQSFEPRSYLYRDQHMVEMSKVLFATPYTFHEETRSGTWTTVRYARKLRRRIFIINPDGGIQS